MTLLRTLARRGRHWRGRFAAFARAARTRAAVQAVAVVVVSALSVVFIVVAVGAAAGRFHIVPIDGAGRDVRVSSTSAGVVVPVATVRLEAGDLVMARTDRSRHDRVYRVEAVDSYTHEVFTIDNDGKLLRLRLGAHAGRVSRVIPWVGAPFALLLGSAQVVVLLAIAGALFLWATYARWRTRRNNSGWRRRRTIALRFVAIVMWCLGTLALTASASFSRTATDAQAISTGNMTLTLGSTSSQANRLNIAATTLAPGDRIQREVDLTVSGAASAIPTAGLTFQIASSNGLDATYGLKIWITRCDRSSGANGWTETASGAPPWTYACNIGDATAQDLLNASNATIPSAGTCTTDNNGTNGYHAASEYTSATALQSTHLPLVSSVLPAGTTVHLVVTMCLPTAAPDSWQDASTLLTFTFNATQRSATNK